MKNLKYHSFILCILGTLCFSLGCSSLQAKIWRVNNRTGINADFISLQAAIDAAEVSREGDTLYIEGSEQSYGDAELDKSLVLIGPGYFLAENTKTQLYKQDAKITRLTITERGKNSSLIGLHFTLSVTISSADNIVIRKCYQSNGGMSVTNSNNLLVEQSLLNGLFLYGGDKFIVRNNWLSRFSNATSAVVDGIATFATNTLLLNNILGYSVNSSILTSTQTTLITNNILLRVTYNGSNDIATHNISSSDQFGSSDGNQANVFMEDVFEDEGQNRTSSLKGFRLKVNSPAIGAGAGGGDCGMFSTDSGGNPYVLSGIPNIPAIYKLVPVVKSRNILKVKLGSITH